MKKLIKILAFLVLFTAAAVGVTYVLIQRTLGEPLIPPKVDLPYEEVTPEAGIDLNGFYDQNHLIITEVEERDGEVRIAYPQIDGLKDETVEAAVNAAIAAKVEEIKADYETQSGMGYLTYQVFGSFGNALSMGFFSADETYNDRQDYLNFDLRDGSTIALEELFCAGADLQAVVRRGFYETLTRYNLSPDYWEELSAPNEEELYRVVRGYLTGARDFAFTPSELYLYFEDYAASVPMTDFAADIAVYHRFLTEDSLFERDDIGYKNIFTCANMPEGFVYRQFGFGAENFWYDVAMEERYDDESVPAAIYEQVDALSEDVYNDLLDEVQTLTETAKANPDRAYILLAKPNVYLYSDSENVNGNWSLIPSKAVTVNEGYMLYEMDRQRFETKYRDALISEYRTNPYYLFYGGIDEAVDGDAVTVTRRDKDVLRLYENGAAITLLELFAGGYDYGSQIRAQAKYDLVSFYNYSLESAEQAVMAAECTLAGTGIEVRLPDWGEDQYLWIALSDFSRDTLTIFP